MPQICILFKTKCLPPFPLKIIWIRHFWANSLKKKKEEEKKNTSFSTPHPPAASWILPLGSLLQNRADCWPWHNGKLAYKSTVTESTGKAFFVKTQENTHAGTKDTLSAQQEIREIMCLFYTHLILTYLKKKKKQLYTYFNYDIFYPFLNPGLPQNNFF